MSKTPRTDAFCEANLDTSRRYGPAAEFARELETELAEAQSVLEQARKALEAVLNDKPLPMLPEIERQCRAALKALTPKAAGGDWLNAIYPRRHRVNGAVCKGMFEEVEIHREPMHERRP